MFADSGPSQLTSVSGLSHQLMEPVQGSEDLILPDVAPLVLPVFRVFDEIADRQSEAARD
jgi:hypothetical protein